MDDWDVGSKNLRSLETERLCLRPFTHDDVGALVQLAGDARVARMTSRLPHPYTAADAAGWIAGHAQAFADGQAAIWAVARLEDGLLIGCVEIELCRRDLVGVLGYWVGVPYWRRGYAKEATAAAVGWACRAGLFRLRASVLADNVASRRLLAGLGFVPEGILRADALREGRRVDVHCLGLLLGAVA